MEPTQLPVKLQNHVVRWCLGTEGLVIHGMHAIRRISVLPPVDCIFESAMKRGYKERKAMLTGVFITGILGKRFFAINVCQSE